MVRGRQDSYWERKRGRGRQSAREKSMEERECKKEGEIKQLTQ